MTAKSEDKFISKAKLQDWLEELSGKFAVFVPYREGGATAGAAAVVYRPFAKGQAPELEKKPTESAKHVVFPRSEALMHFRRDKDLERPGKTSLQIEEPQEPGATLVFGMLSCDARGFLTFDPVYDGSGTEGKARDVYYLKRRAATVLVAKACSKVFSTCFCHWVGGGPAAVDGADVLATEVGAGYLLKPVTERGAAVLDSRLLTQADVAMAEEARASHAAALQALGPAPDLVKAPEALLRHFDDAAFWRDESSHCISCGACTFLCPTCYCFSISDEAAGLGGVRLRSWDACMTPLFTLEASGHNPRPAKAQRLRNRVGHKFSYYPMLHKGRIACCGCGRCIKSCPSSVDIRKIVTDALGVEFKKG